MPRRGTVPAIGGHAIGGVAGALGYAGAAGAEVVQVFVSNPRGWAPAVVDAARDGGFRDQAAAAGVPVFVHAPYLVNFGSPTAETLHRSVDCMAATFARAAAIGARGVVVHTGSAVGAARRDEAMRQLREHLLPVLDALPEGGPRLLLEPVAGGGQALAATVDDLPAYLAALDDHPALGVCLDTCHLFAAGHDVAAPGGMRRVLDRFRRLVGRERLGLLHLNDSRDRCGSARDRHETIGAGTIGTAAFSELLTHPVTRGVPAVVETPGGLAGHTRDIAVLRALRDGTPLPPADG